MQHITLLRVFNNTAAVQGSVSHVFDVCLCLQAKQDLEEKVSKYDPNNDAVVEVRLRQE
jgi:hypothetical protein